jgi:hypothetical protein
MNDHEHALDSAKWVRANVSKNAEFIHADTLRVLARGLISADARISELEAALKSLIDLADLGFRIARLECGVPEIKRFEKNFQLAKEILAGDEK